MDMALKAATCAVTVKVAHQHFRPWCRFSLSVSCADAVTWTFHLVSRRVGPRLSQVDVISSDCPAAPTTVRGDLFGRGEDFGVPSGQFRKELGVRLAALTPRLCVTRFPSSDRESLHLKCFGELCLSEAVGLSKPPPHRW